MLEDNRFEDDETLYVPEVLQDSCEFHCHRMNKVVPKYPARRIIPPRRHDRQCPPPFLPHYVVLYPPTEVRSIVGVYLVSVKLLNLTVYPCGYVAGQIPHGSLAVLRYDLLFRWRCFCHPRLL